MIFLTENEMKDFLRKFATTNIISGFSGYLKRHIEISSSSRLGMPTGTAVCIDIHVKNVSLEATLGECEPHKSGLSPPARGIEKWYLKSRTINEIARVK